MAIKQLINEEELLQKIAEGDQRAFAILYERYHRRIYTFCMRQLKAAERAEEVLQEVFLKIWLMERELLKVNNVAAYLQTIARNRCLDYLRMLEREGRLYGDPETKSMEGHNETEEAILLADTRNLLQLGVEQLPPQQKLVYQLCHQQGLKYEEAAQQLQLSPLTVKNHMQAALKFLRAYISKNSDLAVALILMKIL